MLRSAQAKKVSKAEGDDGHELEDGGRSLGHIHDEINKGIGGLGILVEELVHDLRDDDGEVGLKVLDDVLVDVGYFNHDGIAVVVLDDVMELVYDGLNQMAQMQLVFASQ